MGGKLREEVVGGGDMGRPGRKGAGPCYLGREETPPGKGRPEGKKPSREWGKHPQQPRQSKCHMEVRATKRHG